MAFTMGEYVGPYQFVPPCEPGKKRVPSFVRGASVFSILVTGTLYRRFFSSRSRQYRYPFLPAAATIFLPAFDVNRIGLAAKSQSWKSFLTSWKYPRSAPVLASSITMLHV